MTVLEQAEHGEAQRHLRPVASAEGVFRSAVRLCIPVCRALRLSPQDLSSSVRIQAITELLVEAIQVVVTSLPVLPSLRTAWSFQD